jgi:hypothetical protein
MLAQGNMKSDRNSEQETDPLHSLEQRWPAVKLKEPTINYSLCYYGISILHSQSTPTVTEPQRVRCDWNHSYASFFHVQAVVVVCDACAISRGGRVSSSARTAQISGARLPSRQDHLPLVGQVQVHDEHRPRRPLRVVCRPRRHRLRSLRAARPRSSCCWHRPVWIWWV